MIRLMPRHSKVRIEYMKLGELRPWDRNPKRHDIDSLMASFRRFGFVTPPLVDEGCEQIVAGHGRAEALGRMRDNGEEAPTRITKDKNGEWLVPVLRGVRFRNKQEAEAYLLADNRLVELGGWDDGLLAEVLNDLDDITAIGWTDGEIEALIHVPDFGEDESQDGSRLDEINPPELTKCPECGHEF